MGLNTKSTFSSFHRRPWRIPALLAIIFAITGFIAFKTLNSIVTSNIKVHLQTVLNADVSALLIWLETQKNATKIVAAQRDIQEVTENLLAVAQSGSNVKDILRQSPLQNSSEKIVSDAISEFQFK